MKRRTFALSLASLVSLVSSFSLPAEAMVLRVGVMGAHSIDRLQAFNASGSLRLSCVEGESVFAPNKRVEIVALGNQVSVRFQKRETLRTRSLKLTHATLDGPESPHRRYPGELLVTARDGRLKFVDELSLEEYLPGVLAAETEPGWPLEALKAQAILARTFALHSRHEKEGFDLCDLTHCQVFPGQAGPHPLIEKAVRETEGLVLAYRNRPAQALYHSTCGGSRAANQWVFGGEALSYLKAGNDLEKGKLLCKDSPHAATWKVIVAVTEVSKALQASSETDVGPLKSLRIERNPAGFVQKVTLQGTRSRTVSGYAFWLALGQTLGWGEVKSLNFTMSREGERYLFTGKGLGHSVGMCQWGARKIALMGQSYRTILNRYFPGTTLIPLSRLEGHRS